MEKPADISEDKLAQLEARLRCLEELESVRKTLSAYCKALDTRNAEAIGHVFCHDVSLTVIPWAVELHGRQAVVEFYQQYFRSDMGNSRHYWANELIEADGDAYRSICYFHATDEKGSLSLVGWGTYEDWFNFEDGMWKIARRIITVMALSPITRGWAGQEKMAPLTWQWVEEE